MINFFKKCIRYWNTLRYLKFTQILGRIKYKFRHTRVDLTQHNIKRESIYLWIRSAYRSQKMVSENTFNLLNEVHSISNSDWNNSELSKLWLYNLHYFDDLTALNSNERNDWHHVLIDRWIKENKLGEGCGWEPYPTSLRIINWIKWDLNGNSLKNNWLHSLEIQTRFLSQNIENHLMGNHLFANAKALIFAGLFFDGEEAKRWYVKGCNILKRELSEQILPDGGNFELSPMYHVIFLEDLLDLVNIHRAFSYELPDKLEKNVQPMFSWLQTMCHPDGEISFFNDAALGITPSVEEIQNYGKKLGLMQLSGNLEGKSSLTKLESSGYCRVELDNLVTLIDRSNIGPDYLPAHAHADTLSFELSLFGKRVIVNSGTSVYGISQDRHSQRSTKSHSTVVIDDENSSEVWSGFRVARRAKVFNCKDSIESGKITLSACHNGYHRLYGKPTHCRKWEFTDRLLIIEDRVSGKGSHKIDLVLPLHPDIEIKAISKDDVILGLSGKQIKVKFNGQGSMHLEKSAYYPEFGLSVENSQIHFRLSGELPIEVITRISW